MNLCLSLLLLLGSDLGDLERQIRALIEDQPTVYGIAFALPARDRELFINADDVMHAASTMKTPVMMRLFEMIDQGHLSLQQKVTVSNRFTSIIDGSSFTLTVKARESLYSKMDSQVTLERLIREMIIHSSNLATNLLIELAGAEATTRLMSELGAANTFVLRGVEDLKAFRADRNNTSSARSMLRVMLACVTSPRFSQDSRRQMLTILRAQHYKDMIPAGLPQDSGARIAHKTGAISRVEHDAAIIDLPDGTRYGLTIFTRDFPGEPGRQQARATGVAISKLVYQWVTALE